MQAVYLQAIMKKMWLWAKKTNPIKPNSNQFIACFLIFFWTAGAKKLKCNQLDK